MRLSRNLAAGLASSLGTTVVGLLVVPLYLRYLGLEAYGVVGFLGVVLGLFQVFELGLAPAMSREVARGAALGDLLGAGRLLHALAVLSWTMGLVLGAALALSAPLVASAWLQSRQLPIAAVTQSVAIMGLVVACRWPSALYGAALLGAERQVLASWLSLAGNVTASLGAVAVLAFVSPTLQAMLLWQAVVWLGVTLATRWAAWRTVGRPAGVRFDAGELRRVWRFSAALTVIAVQAIVFTQLDKVLLSRLLTLEQFGGYVLASTVSAGLYLLVTPFFNAIYPRFSSLVAGGQQAGLAALYRVGTRLLAIGLFPVAMVLVFFGAEVVRAWTGDAALAARVGPLVALLAGGSALHGVMYLPYALQLAAGETRLPIVINNVLLVAMVPLLIGLTRVAGATGGAAAWLVLHVLYLLIGTWLTHRRLLPGLAARWAGVEVGVPLGVSAVVFVAGDLTLRNLGWSTWPTLAAAAVLAALAGGLGLAASPELRSAIRADLLDRRRAAVS